jgi:hypothetical protein
MLVLLGIGCGQGPSATATTVRAAESTSVQGELINQDAIFAYPTRVVVADTRLIVVDAAEPFIHVIDLSNAFLAMSFARNGFGPDEFGSIRSVIRRPQANDLWAHDIERNQIRRLEVSTHEGRDTIITLPKFGGTAALDAVWITDSQLALSVANDSASLAVLDVASGKATVLGPALPFGAAETPPASLSDRRRAAVTRMCYEPTHSSLVRAYTYAGRLEAIDLRNNATLTTYAVPSGFAPVFHQDTNTTSFNLRVPGQKIGYLACGAGPEYVFSLFSGRAIGDNRRSLYAASHGDLLQVFAWDGRFLGSIKLNPGITDFSYDASRRILYGVRYFPRPGVFRYPLGPALNSLLTTMALGRGEHG